MSPLNASGSIDGTIGAASPRQLGEVLQGSHIDLILRPSRFLFRPLDLPKRAGEFLEGIVRSQIDRLTPWSAAEAVFGWTPPHDAAKDRIELTVVATARARVAALCAVSHRVPVQSSISVSTLPNIDGRPRGSVEVLQQRWRRHARHRTHPARD